MSWRSVGSSGLPGLASARSTLAGAAPVCPLDCPEKRCMRSGAPLTWGTRGLRQHLLGDAISLVLVDIAGLVDTKLRLQPHQLLLAALRTFAGETGRICAARALALEQHWLRPKGRCIDCVCGLRGFRFRMDPHPTAVFRDCLGLLSGSRPGRIERVAVGAHNVGRRGDRRAVLCGRCGHARRRRGFPVGRGAQDGADPRAIGLGLRPAGGAHRRRDRPSGPARGGNVARDARLHGPSFPASCTSVDRAMCGFV